MFKKYIFVFYHICFFSFAQDSTDTQTSIVSEKILDEKILKTERVVEYSSAPKEVILHIIGENFRESFNWYSESAQGTCWENSPRINQIFISLVDQLSRLSAKQQDLVFEQLERVENLKRLTLTFNNLKSVSSALIKLHLKNPGCYIDFYGNPFFRSPVRGEAPRDLDVLGINAAHAKGLTGSKVNILVIESEAFNPDVLFVPEAFDADIRTPNNKLLPEKTHAHAQYVLSVLAGKKDLTGRSPITTGAKICLEDHKKVWSNSIVMTCDKRILDMLCLKKHIPIYPDYHIANCSFLMAGSWMYGFIRGFQGIIVFGLGNDQTNFQDEDLESLMRDPEIYHKVIFAGALDICGYRQSSYTCMPGRDPFIGRTLFATGGGRNKENEDNLPVIEGNEIKYVRGTSLATPMITGALALLFEYAQQQALDLDVDEILSPQQLATILLKTANKAIFVDDGSNGHKLGYDPAKHGQGKIDLEAAMQAVDRHYAHSLSAIKNRYSF